MRSVIAVLALIICWPVGFAPASQLVPFELSNLITESELVVVAEVAAVSPIEIDSRTPTPFDQVELNIAGVIKGELEESVLSIVLEPRGVRGFDPSLTVGDSGVFFLRKATDGRTRPVTFGAVALFGNRNFVVTKDEAARQPDEPDDR